MNTPVDERLTIDLQQASASKQIPTHAQVTRWVHAALHAAQGEYTQAEVSIRIVDNEESQSLNSQYRQKDKPTNVLSFPADIPDFIESPLLGDLVVCAPVVECEAHEQGKTLEAHWAHMLIHGTLHLLGYDHIDDSCAEIMERLEIRILSSLGFASPYEDNA